MMTDERKVMKTCVDEAVKVAEYAGKEHGLQLEGGQVFQMVHMMYNYRMAKHMNRQAMAEMEQPSDRDRF